MGGRNKVAMADLRALAADLGFDDVRTVLQSGNLVFKGAARASGTLEKLFETETTKRLGLGTSFFVRTAAEWKKIVAGNPFRDEAKSDPSHLAVMFLKDRPAKKDLEALKSAVVGREYFHASGRELYAAYPDGFGNSKFTLPLIDRRLQTTGTGRNWNTVLKLAKLAGE
jgi:uncharacterized protein (DUF1697 family)